MKLETKSNICNSLDLGPRSSPVSARLALKEVVEPPHLVGRDGEARQVAVHGADLLDQPVQRALALLPNFV